MTAPVHVIIAAAFRTGDLASLYSMLDCDRYTREQDFRALDGYGWLPRQLSETERNEINAAIAEIEERPS